MGTGSAARIGYCCLTGLYALLPLLGLTTTRSRRFSRTNRSWSEAVLYLGPLLLVATSVWDLHIEVSRWMTVDLRFDIYTHIAAIVGALSSLLITSLGYSITFQLIYDVLCCFIWTLAYPLTHSRPSVGAVAVPLLYILDGTILLVCASENVPQSKTHTHPLTGQISFLLRVTLSWLNPLLRKSASGILNPEDIWELDEHQNVRRFLGETDNESSPHPVGLGHSLPKSIVQLILRDYSPVLLASAALEIGYLLLSILQPFLVRILIERQEMPFVVALFASGIFLGIFYYHAMMLVRLVGMQLRSALTARVSDKGMLLPGNSGASDVDPSVLNEVDLFNVFRMVEVVNELWVVPLHALLSLSALTYILGWRSVLAGLMTALLVVPILAWVIQIMARRLALLMVAKDRRVSLVSEVLASIKHVKLYGWQAILERRIYELRTLELKTLGRVAFSNLTSSALSNLIPTIMVSVSFGTHIFLTGSLTSSAIFPSLILFNGVARWMEQLPRTLMTWKTGVVSYKRVQEFLMMDGPSQEEVSPISTFPSDGPTEVRMVGAVVNMPGSRGEPGCDKTLLKSVNFRADQGALTVITGPVGAGKTTFLRTILGELQPVGGSVHVSGQVAYSTQRPFLFNGSIRDNILFGLPLDLSWYQKVLDSVCLCPDLALLPSGDATVLGGTGPTLSGGQQSRVALARAVYSRRPLVILDDPVASMDPNVERKLIENVLGPNGILQHQTRIVTTSSQTLIQQASTVYSIENGIMRVLPPPQIQANYQASVPESDILAAVEPVVADPERFSYGTSKPCHISRVEVRNVDDLEANEESTLLIKPAGTADNASSLAKVRNTGVAFSTYLAYLKSAKPWGWPIVLGLAMSCTILEIRGAYYLQEAGQEFETVGHSTKLISYIICRVVGSAFVGLFVLAGFFGCLIPAGDRLHSKLTKGVLNSQFGFFDTTPLGSIISRFTTDMNRMDGPVASGLISICMTGTNVVCSILVVVSTSTTSVLYLVPLAALYFYIQKFYLSAYRHLRRLDNEARGPILTAANEMRVGFSVILAYQQAEFFSERVRDFINDHLRVWAPFLCLDIWLQLRLYTLACVVQSLTAVLLLAVGVPSSTLGLVMSFVLQITNLLGFLVQTSANLEADLTSLERISEYSGNPPESDVLDDPELPTSWPLKPSITFENFSAAYQPGGPLCLRNINICIPEGQRVAVVGRTGAGKSSLVLALMRGIDRQAVSQGSRILIDGLDIMTEVPLSELRKKMTIIPQDPVVFSGTIRENLDPGGSRPEEELRSAVAVSRLVEVLGLAPGDDPLEFRISDGGRGLSTGQTQLLAIARAIVAKPAIVIVDEATSAIDVDTATLINAVMHQAFHGITTITVAHQIWSVMDYDSILVFDHGSVVEFSSPKKLLQNPESWFSRIARDAGIET